MKPDWLKSVLVDDELAKSIESSLETLISILERGLENTNTNNKKDALVKVKFFEKQFDTLPVIEKKN